MTGTPANNHRQTPTPQAPPDLAEVLFADGTGGLEVSLEHRGTTLLLVLRGTIVRGPAPRFFGRLLRLGQCFRAIDRRVVFDLTDVTEIDHVGFAYLLEAVLCRRHPFTVLLRRGVTEPWLRPLAQLTQPRTAVEDAIGAVIPLHFGVTPEHPATACEYPCI